MIPCLKALNRGLNLNRKLRKHIKLIFGHWAALQGKSINPQIQNVDGGCVWGNQLIAYRLEDKEIFKVNNPMM